MLNLPLKTKPTVNIHRKRLFSSISFVNSAGHSGSMKDKNELILITMHKITCKQSKDYYKSSKMIKCLEANIRKCSIKPTLMRGEMAPRA